MSAYPPSSLPTHPHRHTQELSPTFKRLAEDENVKMRRSIALGFHEVRRREGKGRVDGDQMEGEREEVKEGGETEVRRE